MVPTGTGGRRTIKLIDWEAAGRAGTRAGMPGSVSGNTSASGPLHPHYRGGLRRTALELARYPLPGIQPALRRFWQAYTPADGAGWRDGAEWLLRAVCYAAARLVQTAFEQGQGAVQMTGNALCFLQVSLNMSATAGRSCRPPAGHPLAAGAAGVSDYRDQIAAVVQATTFPAPGAYTWFGVRSPRLPATVRRAG